MALEDMQPEMHKADEIKMVRRIAICLLIVVLGITIYHYAPEIWSALVRIFGVSHEDGL